MRSYYKQPYTYSGVIAVVKMNSHNSRIVCDFSKMLEEGTGTDS